MGETALGQLVTFYSYKGGTGRTMALSNVSCLLAQQSASQNGKGVLIIDWDLEAPGLHRFFGSRLSTAFGSLRSVDKALTHQDGLVDLFRQLERQAPPGRAASRERANTAADALVASIDFERFTIRTDVPALSLMTAGRFGSNYSRNVNTFDWERLYSRVPPLFRRFGQALSERYDYVLIDSRTGLSDTSGISTMLMPEKLVVDFTPNRQSLTGLSTLIRRALEYRRQSDDLRPLVVFPLASRVEAAEPTLRTQWRFGDPAHEIDGYQPTFERLLGEAYDLPECSLSEYFQEVAIQHEPRYSYGEEIAVLIEREQTLPQEVTERLSLGRSYETFVERLTNLVGPWEPWSAGAARRAEGEVNAFCERAMNTLEPERHHDALRALTRLVRVSDRGESLEDGRTSAGATEFAAEIEASLRVLAKSRLVISEKGTDGEDLFLLSSDDVVRFWRRLRDLIASDREFLQWRQRLHSAASEWTRSGRDSSLTLTGARFAEALEWLNQRRNDLSADELAFIRASTAYLPQNIFRPGGAERADSPFYLERKQDRQALNELRRTGGVTVVVYGPRGYGKTTLLFRMVQAARDSGQKTAFVDLTSIDLRQGPRSLWRDVVGVIARDCDIEIEELSDSRDERVTSIIERRVLATLQTPLLLAFDEVDILRGVEYGDDVWGVFRSWHNLRAGRKEWRRLSLVLASASSPGYALNNQGGAMSPFNVGFIVRLEQFTMSETAELNRRYDNPFSVAQLSVVRELIGGYPYLIRLALYTVASGQMTAEEFLEHAGDDSGPFEERFARLHNLPGALEGLACLARGQQVDADVGGALVQSGFAQERGGRIVPVGRLFAEHAARLTL